MQPFVNTGLTVPEPQRDLRWQDVLERSFAAMAGIEFLLYATGLHCLPQHHKTVCS